MSKVDPSTTQGDAFAGANAEEESRPAVLGMTSSVVFASAKLGQCCGFERAGCELDRGLWPRGADDQSGRHPHTLVAHCPQIQLTGLVRNEAIITGFADGEVVFAGVLWRRLFCW